MKKKQFDKLVADYEKAIENRRHSEIDRLCVQIESRADLENYVNHGKLRDLHTRAEMMEFLPWKS